MDTQDKPKKLWLLLIMILVSFCASLGWYFLIPFLVFAAWKTQEEDLQHIFVLRRNEQGSIDLLERIILERKKELIYDE